MIGDEYYEFYMWCWLGVFACVFLIFWVQVYFSYCKVAAILECLGHSRIVMCRKAFLGSDFLSRTFFVLTIAGMLAFPAAHIKEGAFTREEFDGIPSRLKFQLSTLVYMTFFLVAIAITLWIIGWSKGWLG
ncbi:MAG: hypothetical protein GAK37_03428 [Pseudomonas sp.]|nr:MAG: hypothetical protein GAK37_03428 [Pseudomonas sp.]